MPTDSLFQYQQLAKPVFTGPEQVTESRWHQPWSEPVRVKIDPRLAIALAASGPFFTPETFGEIIFISKWFAPFSDPVRIKQGLSAAAQQTLTSQGPINPIVSFGYYNWLSEPVRIKLRTPPGAPDFSFGDERPLVNFSYFNWLSEPVRLKPRLLEGLQEFLERASFIPVSYSASLNVTEQGDFLQAVLYQFNLPITALVDIITNDPSHRGNVGIIAPLPQSSIVTAIIEPNSVQATGIVSPVVAAGARVAIITGP
jgi:hypothetical protein